MPRTTTRTKAVYTPIPIAIYHPPLRTSWLVPTKYFCFGSQKTEFLCRKNGFKFFSKIQNSDFCQKWEIFFRFLHRSLAKLRRTAKRPTVLSSLLKMLTILITLRKIYFLANILIFCRGCITFFRKMAKN